TSLSGEHRLEAPYCVQLVTISRLGHTGDFCRPTLRGEGKCPAAPAGHKGPGGMGWNVATPASAVTRTVRPGTSGTAVAMDLGLIPPMTDTRRRKMIRPGQAADPRPRTTS